jgi:hypothetical protein
MPNDKPQDKSFAALEDRLARLEALIAQKLPPIFDPAPDDIGRWGGLAWGGWRTAGRVPFDIPTHGDPPPLDISRLSRVQLQVALESIKAQRIRLDAIEGGIKQQLKQTG